MYLIEKSVEIKLKWSEQARAHDCEMDVCMYCVCITYWSRSFEVNKILHVVLWLDTETQNGSY